MSQRQPGGAQASSRRRSPGPQPLAAAVLKSQGKFVVAEPLFTRSEPITIQRNTRDQGGPGDLVLVGPGKGGKARVMRKIGDPAVVRDVLEALMLENGLWRTFPPRALEEAQAVAVNPQDYPRKDLTDLPTFTMDPVTAKDYDDAISARREEGAVRVWVHIADVSAYVRPGGALDSEAYRRSFSTYVPGSVEPMLPHELSSNACSLVPNEPRNTVTAEILLREGEAISAEFYRALIRSDARLTYEQVDEIFAGQERASGPWGEPLELARAVSGTLEKRRKAAGALEVNSREPKFTFDQAGHVTAVEMEQQTESHRVIEHLMVLANEQVAEHLDRHKVPTLYRIHERPDPESVQALVGQLESLEVPTPPLPTHMTGQEALDMVSQISRSISKHVKQNKQGRAALTSLLLRSLKMAVYSPQNLGHSGLRSKAYAHFTSPIRRYPDLIVHRGLLHALGVDAAKPESGEMFDAGVETSRRERESMKIERKANDICRAFLLQNELNETGWDAKFEGEVVGMVASGLFISFGDDRQFEGFLPLRKVDGYWNLNEQVTAVVEESTGTQVRLGDDIDIEVEKIDAARGRTDLIPPSE